MSRYYITRGNSFLWTCHDADTGLSIVFRDGMFNDTQSIDISGINAEHIGPSQLPGILASMSDWLASNYGHIVECSIEDRSQAISTLCMEQYWQLLADILRRHVTTDKDGLTELFEAVEDADSIIDKHGLDRAETHYVIGRLSDTEAHEVFRMIDAFWKMQEEYNIDVGEWARDIIWWPSFIPYERHKAQSAEDFGRALRDARQSNDITIQELSQRSGVDLGLISKIENGKANPTLQNLLKLSNAMGCYLVFNA